MQADAIVVCSACGGLNAAFISDPGIRWARQIDLPGESNAVQVVVVILLAPVGTAPRSLKERLTAMYPAGVIKGDVVVTHSRHRLAQETSQQSAGVTNCQA